MSTVPSSRWKTSIWVTSTASTNSPSIAQFICLLSKVSTVRTLSVWLRHSTAATIRHSANEVKAIELPMCSLPKWEVPYWMSESRPMVMASPTSPTVTTTGLVSTDSPRGRGLRPMSPGVSRSKPSRQDEDNQQDKYKTDVLGEVVIDLAALLHREDDRGEVVVGQDHPAGVLGHLGAGAHGDPDVGRLDGGRVVDAVAGHGHHMALFLERVGEEHLVLGGDPAEHPDVVDAGQPLGLGQVGEVRAQDGLARDPDLLGDGRAGDDIVPGHHADDDVGRLGAGDRVLGLVPRRVDHPDQAGQLQFRDVAEQVAGRVEY